MIKLLIIASSITVKHATTGANSYWWYMIGAVMALLIFVFLLVVLSKPEKF